MKNMMEGLLPLKGNEGLVDEYFEHLFFRGEEKVLNSLRRHCNLEDCCVFDCYIGCEFAAEYSEDEEGYFGENVVGIYYTPPVKERFCQVILTYEEFYGYAERKYMAYAEKHQHCKEEIAELLEQLKKVLLKA